MDSLHSLLQLHDLDKKKQTQLALQDEKQAEKAVVAFKQAPKPAIRKEQEKALLVQEPDA